MKIRFDPDVKLYSGINSRVKIEHKNLDVMIAAAEALALKEKEEEEQMRKSLIQAEKALNDAKLRLKKSNFKTRKAAKKAVIEAQAKFDKIKSYFEDEVLEIDGTEKISEEALDEEELILQKLVRENMLRNQKDLE